MIKLFEEFTRIYPEDNDGNIITDSQYKTETIKKIIKRYSKKLNRMFHVENVEYYTYPREFSYVWGNCYGFICVNFYKCERDNYYIVKILDDREKSLKRIKNNLFDPNYLSMSDYTVLLHFDSYGESVDFLTECGLVINN